MKKFPVFMFVVILLAGPVLSLFLGIAEAQEQEDARTTIIPQEIGALLEQVIDSENSVSPAFLNQVLTEPLMIAFLQRYGELKIEFGNHNLNIYLRLGNNGTPGVQLRLDPGNYGFTALSHLSEEYSFYGTPEKELVRILGLIPISDFWQEVRTELAFDFRASLIVGN